MPNATTETSRWCFKDATADAKSTTAHSNSPTTAQSSGSKDARPNVDVAQLTETQATSSSHSSTGKSIHSSHHAQSRRHIGLPSISHGMRQSLAAKGKHTAYTKRNEAPPTTDEAAANAEWSVPHQYRCRRPNCARAPQKAAHVGIPTQRVTILFHRSVAARQSQPKWEAEGATSSRGRQKEQQTPGCTSQTQRNANEPKGITPLSHRPFKQAGTHCQCVQHAGRGSTAAGRRSSRLHHSPHCTGPHVGRIEATSLNTPLAASNTPRGPQPIAAPLRLRRQRLPPPPCAQTRHTVARLGAARDRGAMPRGGGAALAPPRAACG